VPQALHHERDAHAPTDNRPAPALGEHLKFLWALVGSAVVLRGRQQSRVISQLEFLHQRRDKLLGRQTT
jgi:hypothetical protein